MTCVKCPRDIDVKDRSLCYLHGLDFICIDCLRDKIRCICDSICIICQRDKIRCICDPVFPLNHPKVSEIVWTRILQRIDWGQWTLCSICGEATYGKTD